MGSNPVTVKKLIKFLRNNKFSNVIGHGHNTVTYEPTGQKITINFHRTKGKGISYYALREIAKVMKITKHQLVNLITN